MVMWQRIPMPLKPYCTANAPKQETNLKICWEKESLPEALKILNHFKAIYPEQDIPWKERPFP